MINPTLKELFETMDCNDVAAVKDYNGSHGYIITHRDNEDPRTIRTISWRKHVPEYTYAKKLLAYVKQHKENFFEVRMGSCSCPANVYFKRDTFLDCVSIRKANYDNSMFYVSCLGIALGYYHNLEDFCNKFLKLSDEEKALLLLKYEAGGF